MLTAPQLFDVLIKHGERHGPDCPVLVIDRGSDPQPTDMTVSTLKMVPDGSIPWQEQWCRVVSTSVGPSNEMILTLAG